MRSRPARQSWPDRPHRSTRPRVAIAALTAGFVVLALALTGAAPAAAVDPGCPTVDPVTHAVTPPPAQYAVWTGCDLTGAAAPGADLRFATMTGTILTGADLRNAILGYATLRDAKLDGANISGAELYGADLTGADLTGVTATGTQWSYATCPDGSRATWHVGGTCLDPAMDPRHRAVSVSFIGATYVGPAAAVSSSTVVTATVGLWEQVAGWQMRWATGRADGTLVGGWHYPASWVRSPYYPNWAVLLGAAPGHRYCFAARGRDPIGNLSAWSPSACITIPYDDRSLRASPSWHRSTWAGWIRNTVSSTTRRGATLTTTRQMTVRRIGVVATLCRTCGTVAVYVGKYRVGVLDLDRSVYQSHALVLLDRFPTRRHGVVRLVVTSNHRLVRLDGVVMSAT